MTQSGLLKNYINGSGYHLGLANHLPVDNPATGEVLGQVPVSPKDEVDQAARRRQQPSKTGDGSPRPSGYSTCLS
jgi:malonate-semialdehyde dehydrogenase (acetylating)/methylmalonate-semialdehyde dehydrogenase